MPSPPRSKKVMLSLTSVEHAILAEVATEFEEPLAVCIRELALAAVDQPRHVVQVALATDAETGERYVAVACRRFGREVVEFRVGDVARLAEVAEAMREHGFKGDKLLDARETIARHLAQT